LVRAEGREFRIRRRQLIKGSTAADVSGKGAVSVGGAIWIDKPNDRSVEGDGDVSLCAGLIASGALPVSVPGTSARNWQVIPGGGSKSKLPAVLMFEMVPLYKYLE